MWRYGILLILGFILAGCKKEETPKIDYVEELQSVSRLELGRMTVGKVGMITDPHGPQSSGLMGKAEELVNSLKVGTRIGVYSYDTYLIASIDLGRLSAEDVEIDEENKRVRIMLPPVEVTTDGREVELHEEHSRVTGLRSAITPAERARLKSKMAAEVKKEMAADRIGKTRLKATAEAKARGWMREYFGARGYDAEVIIQETGK
ncbi:MAG: DUF4230 domain-containing protein [Muribaculaceae bacterium]|nr:DUF4230 domain-containing protein [Muribaculaceae bacterium]